MGSEIFNRGYFLQKYGYYQRYTVAILCKIQFSVKLKLSWARPTNFAEPGGSPPPVGPAGLLIFLPDLIGNLLSPPNIKRLNNSQIRLPTWYRIRNKETKNRWTALSLLTVLVPVTRTRDSQASRNAEMRSSDALWLENRCDKHKIVLPYRRPWGSYRN